MEELSLSGFRSSHMNEKPLLSAAELEGLFIATVTGPGPIWLQSLPFLRPAGSIVSAAGGGPGLVDLILLGVRIQ